MEEQVLGKREIKPAWMELQAYLDENLSDGKYMVAWALVVKALSSHQEKLKQELVEKIEKALRRIRAHHCQWLADDICECQESDFNKALLEAISIIKKT